MAAPFPSPTAVWRTETYPTLSPTRPELSAKGKTVLITGGGTGIGAETAHYFAQAGASRIALVGRREQPLLDCKKSIEAKYPSIDVFAASTDVTKKNEVDAAFDTFVGSGGKIDVVVSNAAVIGPQDPVKEADADRFLAAIYQNLQGAIYVSQAFLHHMAAEAVAINVSSSAATVNFGPGFASYNVAKLAVFRLWDSLGFSNPGVSVFHIQPGVIDTAMNKEAGGIAAVGFQDNINLPASFNVWLASPEARFLRGKFLWVNWDVDELKTRAEELETTQYLNVGLVGWPFGEAGFQAKFDRPTD